MLASWMVWRKATASRIVVASVIARLEHACISEFFENALFPPQSRRCIISMNRPNK
jgi:hypothetical protein